MKLRKNSHDEDRADGLSDAALVVLSHAASRHSRMVLPLPASFRVRGGAKDRLLRKLLRLGMVDEVPGSEAENAWRTGEDEGRVGLRISARGLRTIGIEDGAADIDGQSESAAESPAFANDSEGAKGHRIAIAGNSSHAAKADAAARSRVRPGSKQALLVERLSSGTGCTLDELAELLGWQRHTVRAALTGLRQKGFRVTKSKSEEGESRYHAFA
jgi:hypothetical protein